jgi:hypothetical protein
MNGPTLTDAHRKLAQLVGTWVGEEEMFPSPWLPEGGTATGIVENTSGVGGLIVVQEYQQERDGVITFQGHGVFAHDPVKGNYVMHWFDSMGPTPNIYEGDFDGDTLNMTMKMMEGWSKASFELTSPDSYTFGMDVSQDGKNWAPMMKGSYTRKE